VLPKQPQYPNFFGQDSQDIQDNYHFKNIKSPAPSCSHAALFYPAPISHNRPPLHHILPRELRRQVFDERGTPGLCSLQPFVFYAERRWGFSKGRGEGRQAFDGRGAEQHKYHTVNIYMAALNGSRSNN